MFIDFNIVITLEAQAFSDLVSVICDISSIDILLLFRSKVRQLNLFRVGTVSIRNSQCHATVSSYFIFTVAACCRVCNQAVVSFGKTVRDFRDINIECLIIITCQCQSLTVIGYCTRCNIRIFQTCYFSSQTVCTGHVNFAVAVCFIASCTALQVFIVFSRNTRDITDVSSIC